MTILKMIKAKTKMCSRCDSISGFNHVFFSHLRESVVANVTVIQTKRHLWFLSCLCIHTCLNFLSIILLARLTVVLFINFGDFCTIDYTCEDKKSLYFLTVIAIKKCKLFFVSVFTLTCLICLLCNVRL